MIKVIKFGSYVCPISGTPKQVGQFFAFLGMHDHIPSWAVVSALSRRAVEIYQSSQVIDCSLVEQATL